MNNRVAVVAIGGSPEGIEGALAGRTGTRITTEKGGLR